MTQPTQNTGREAAADELSQLAPLAALSNELRDYPVRLLLQVCEQADKRKGPVPDHTLTFVPYLGETTIRALVEGGYVERLDDVPYAILAYMPTERGRALAASLR
ncbi:MAG: hypothetical protein O2826_02810 [Chloroflexi bacterium]|nr:hypothetical protein [Chloroflexota bacterium]